MKVGIEDKSWTRIEESVIYTEQRTNRRGPATSADSLRRGVVFVKPTSSLGSSSDAYNAVFQRWDNAAVPAAWADADEPNTCYARDVNGAALTVGTVYLGAVAYQYEADGSVLVEVVGGGDSPAAVAANCREKLASLGKTDGLAAVVTAGAGACAEVEAQTVYLSRPDPAAEVWTSVTDLVTGRGTYPLRFTFSDDGDPKLTAVSGSGSGSSSVGFTYLGCDGSCALFLGRPILCDSDPVADCTLAAGGAPRRYRLTALAGTGDFDGMASALAAAYTSGCDWSVTSGSLTLSAGWVDMGGGTRRVETTLADAATGASVTWAGPTVAYTGDSTGCTDLGPLTQVSATGTGTPPAAPTLEAVGPCAVTACGDNGFLVKLCCSALQPCSEVADVLAQPVCFEADLGAYFDVPGNPDPPSGCAGPIRIGGNRYDDFGSFGVTYLTRPLSGCGWAAQRPDGANPDDPVWLPCVEHAGQRGLMMYLIYDATNSAGLGVGWVGGFCTVGTGGGACSAARADVTSLHPFAATFPAGGITVSVTGVSCPAEVYIVDGLGACKKAWTSATGEYPFEVYSDFSCTTPVAAGDWYCVTLTGLDHATGPGSCVGSFPYGPLAAPFPGGPGAWPQLEVANGSGGYCFYTYTVNSGPYATRAAAEAVCP